MPDQSASTPLPKLRVAFVVQRYGAEVNGGAEAHCRFVAERMTRYWNVDVLTTRALDYITWEDHYPEGIELLNEVTIRRFSVPVPRDIERFNRASEALVSAPQPTLEQMEDWMRKQGPVSPGLLDYIATSRERYDVFIFFGYLYANSYFGLPLVAEKAIFAPLAHDEWAIHLGMWDRIFALPRWYMFNTVEERRFLRRRFPGAPLNGRVVGVAMERPSEIRPERFRASYGLDDEFVLYVGRVDPSKGCQEMFDHFLEHLARSSDDRTLVTLGRPVMPIPEHPRIRSLGFVPEMTKWDALAACDLLLMPSPFESLSMVLLEAWSVGKPVLVNAACEVLRGQVRRSNGGIEYRTREEFSRALTALSRGGTANVLGRQGYEFVRAKYYWSAVERAYIEAAEPFTTPV